MPAYASGARRVIQLLSFCVVLVIAGMAQIAFAVIPTNGYFTDTDLQPVGSATIETVETEPAVALIFAVDQKTADITRQFNDWYLSSSRPDINVFAVAVNTGNMSQDVVLEAINQRDLAFPVYLASVDILYGDDFRLFVLNNDRAVERFSTFESEVLNAAVSRLGIPVPEVEPVATPSMSPEVGAPEPAPAVTPTPAAAVSTPEVIQSITTTTTTVSENDIEPSSVIMGGETTDNVYVNDIYGFRVEFPPNWRYQVAARRDGAVAVEPTGSQIDMRVWALSGDVASNPQAYIDQRLESLARKLSTRVNIERRFEVTEDGVTGLDVTYNFTKPIDPDVPMRGFLMHRGRIQVFVHDGYVKAASVEAPAGEFTATYPMIESFFLSFEIEPAGYTSPVL